MNKFINPDLHIVEMEALDMIMASIEDECSEDCPSKTSWG